MANDCGLANQRRARLRRATMRRSRTRPAYQARYDPARDGIAAFRVYARMSVHRDELLDHAARMRAGGSLAAAIRVPGL